MISLYKNSLSRLDLASVLEQMVQNAIDGIDAGKLLAKQMASLLHCSDGISLRTPSDAILVIIELLRENELNSPALILLPVTCSRTLARALHRTQHELFFYDLANDGMSPLINEATFQECRKKTEESPVIWIRSYNFGMSHRYSLQLPSLLADIPAVNLGFTIPSATVEESGEQEIPDENPQNTVEELFNIVVMEQNSFITSASGAVLCVKERKTARKLRTVAQSYYQLSDFNAALAHSQLKQLRSFTEKVVKIREHYVQACTRNRHQILESVLEPDTVLQSFPLKILSGTVEVMKFIQKQKIEAKFAYRNSELSRLLNSLPQQKEQFMQTYPGAMQLLQETIELPLYATLNAEEVHTIAKTLAALP